ncbi:MAG: M50 family metallopeptidase, partial [candidate division Zixibacteria bacterium]
MTSVLSFIFVLGVLIFIHELGHFLVAKKVGIFVERFSIGFPPYIFTRKFGATLYSIGLIPLGGFVKMKGENPDEESAGDNDEFMAKSVPQRAAVIFAGPFMNYVLAIIIMSALLFFSGRPIVDTDRILVGEVMEESPASLAGLQDGDQIISVDDHPVNSFDSMRVRINARVAEPVQIGWVRDGDTLTASMTTIIGEQMNEEAKIDSVGMIGIGEKVLGRERLGIGEAVYTGSMATHELVVKTFEFVGRLVTGQVSMKMIGGPLFIAQQSGREAAQGASRLFLFMALLSVNLAVLNVLPIPILDGGHL